MGYNKDVKDFTFPSNFGFTGSASDSPRINVRPHERARPQRYARGGKVRKADGGIIDKIKGFFGSDDKDAGKQVAQSTPAPPPPPKGDTVRVEPKGSTADTLKNQRERQMKELGLNKGGRVKHKHKVKKYHGASFPAEDFDNDSGSEPDMDADDAPAMAKGGKFIQKAIKRPGAFKAKAKKAGMSTAAFAAKVTKPGSKASTLTKQEGNLAKTLAKVRPHAKGGKVRYAEGGDVKQDKAMINAALKKHVNTPAPKGHKGLKSC